MKKEREEDFEANLTGDEEPGWRPGKPRWFKRIRKGILRPLLIRKKHPEGLWNKCPECNYICTTTELKGESFCLSEM
jgi:acetyl-CoA carboxylase carboxyl transferase subunit beta